MGHRNLIKNKTQTAVINILNLHILIMTTFRMYSTYRLCRLQVPTPTPMNWATQRIGNQKPPQRAARHGARRYRTEFSNLNLNLSEQIWLSYFWNVFFYKRGETNAKQTVRFNSRQTICLEQFLLRLFYFILFFSTVYC